MHRFYGLELGVSGSGLISGLVARGATKWFEVSGFGFQISDFLVARGAPPRFHTPRFGGAGNFDGRTDKSNCRQRRARVLVSYQELKLNSQSYSLWYKCSNSEVRKPARVVLLECFVGRVYAGDKETRFSDVAMQAPFAIWQTRLCRTSCVVELLFRASPWRGVGASRARPAEVACTTP